jgi:hypothetical protein
MAGLGPATHDFAAFRIEIEALTHRIVVDADAPIEGDVGL